MELQSWISSMRLSLAKCLSRILPLAAGPRQQCSVQVFNCMPAHLTPFMTSHALHAVLGCSQCGLASLKTTGTLNPKT